MTQVNYVANKKKYLLEKLIKHAQLINPKEQKKEEKKKQDLQQVEKNRIIVLISQNILVVTLNATGLSVPS